MGECGRGCFWAVEFVASLGGAFGSSEGRGGGGEYGTCKTFVVRGIMLCVCALESLMDMNA